MRLRLLIPQVNTAPLTRPRGCRWCGSVLLQRHQTVRKTVIDTQVRDTQAVRYRCTDCRRTFRQYAEGVSRARQSQRVVGLAVLLWTLGLSEWATSIVLKGLEAGIHRSTVHRDRLRAGLLLQQRHALPAAARVLGADETVVRVRGQGQLIGFVVNSTSGKTVGVNVLVEQDSAAFRRWLGPYAEALGVEVLVTDDLATYKPVSRALGLRQQVCLTHVRKWVGQAPPAGRRLGGGTRVDPGDRPIVAARRRRAPDGAGETGARLARAAQARGGPPWALADARLPSGAALGAGDQQPHRAGDRQEQGAVQDGAGLQEHQRSAGRHRPDAMGLQRRRCP